MYKEQCKIHVLTMFHILEPVYRTEADKQMLDVQSLCINFTPTTKSLSSIFYPTLGFLPYLYDT